MLTFVRWCSNVDFYTNIKKTYILFMWTLKLVLQNNLNQKITFCRKNSNQRNWNDFLRIEFFMLCIVIIFSILDSKSRHETIKINWKPKNIQMAILFI